MIQGLPTRNAAQPGAQPWQAIASPPSASGSASGCKTCCTVLLGAFRGLWSAGVQAGRHLPSLRSNCCLAARNAPAQAAALQAATLPSTPEQGDRHATPAPRELHPVDDDATAPLRAPRVTLHFYDGPVDRPVAPAATTTAVEHHVDLNVNPLADVIQGHRQEAIEPMLIFHEAPLRRAVRNTALPAVARDIP